MECELDVFIPLSYQNAIPADFPKILSVAENKFKNEIDSLITVWGRYSAQLTQINQTEEEYKEGCCFKAYDNRYIVIPVGILVAAGGIAGVITGLALKATLVGAGALYYCGWAMLGGGLVTAAIPCSKQLATIEGLESDRTSVNHKKDMVKGCVNVLNHVGKLCEKWRLMTKDCSESNIKELFAAFDSVQKTDNSLAAKDKDVEKLFLLKDIVREQKNKKSNAEIVTIWKNFKTSQLSSMGNILLLQPFEKYGLNRTSADSILDFFKKKKSYEKFESQIAKKISAVQLQVRTIVNASKIEEAYRRGVA
jgi:hypothetical protein